MIKSKILIIGIFFFIASCSETKETTFNRMPVKFNLPSPMSSIEGEIIFLNDTAIAPFKKIKCEWGGLKCAKISQNTELRSLSKDDECDIIYDYMGDNIRDEMEFDMHGKEHGCLLSIRYKYIWDLENRLITQILTEGRESSMYPQELEYTYDDEGKLSSSSVSWMWAKDESQFFNYDEKGNLIQLENRYAQCDTGGTGNDCGLYISKFFYEDGELQRVEIQSEDVNGGEIREKIKNRELEYKSNEILTKMIWEKPNKYQSDENINSYKEFISLVDEYRYNL